MALPKKVSKKQIIEVTVDEPKERTSTQIQINDQFTIDLEDLNYKKSKEATNEIYSERQPKNKETNYLVEIDDGPKRLTDRSDYNSTTSVDTLNVQARSDQESTSEHTNETTSKEAIGRFPEELVDDIVPKKIEPTDEEGKSRLPQELLDEDIPKFEEQSPATSHTEQVSVKKKRTTSVSPTRNGKGIKTKTKTDEKRFKKSDQRASKPTKSKQKDENRTHIDSSILSRRDELSESRRSVYRTNDAGNGIEIIVPSYLLPDDNHFESVVWTPEERGLFFKEHNFTHQQCFRTDIFHIHRKGLKEVQKSKGQSYKYLHYPDIDASNITVKVHIPDLSHMNGLCLNFKAHIRFKKQWNIIQTEYNHSESIVTFNCNQMDSFCITSTPREDKHIVTPDGYEYVSEADSRIKIDFPSRAVSRDEAIDVRVIPLNRKSMANKIESNPRNCFILAISECLAVRHSVSAFDQLVHVQLPVDDLPGIDTTNVDCKYGVFKRKHKGSFWLTNLEVEERNGVPTITVESFSEYVILKVKSEMFGKLQALLPEEIEIAIGDKMCCKLLFFVGSRKPNSISVMLECTTKDSMEDVTQRRRQMGYELVRQCPSPDFFFPVNQRIRVDVGGRFSLTKHIGKGYYFLTFFPIAADNFICFPVERYNGMVSAVYGIISFKEDNGAKKDLHAIHYDPWSSRGKPQTRPTPASGSRSAPVSRQMTAASDVRHRMETGFDDVFFSDKGLLAVAQSLSPDSMFKVVINLEMTKAQYEQITNDYSALTTSSRHLQLLKTALEISNSEPKIQRLASALRDSDENGIADKIEELYFEKMKLSRTNLERRKTIVTIQDDEQSSRKD